MIQALLGNRLLGLVFAYWAAILVGNWLGKSVHGEGRPEHRPDPSFVWVILAAASWAAVLGQVLPRLAVDVSGKDTSFLVLDTRFPLLPSLLLLWVYSRAHSRLPELTPWIPLAAFLADPGFLDHGFLFSGTMRMNAGEGLPNLVLLLFPPLSLVAGRSASHSAPGNHAHARIFGKPAMVGVLCLLALLFLGLIPALLVMTAWYSLRLHGRIPMRLGLLAAVLAGISQEAVEAWTFPGPAWSALAVGILIAAAGFRRPPPSPGPFS